MELSEAQKNARALYGNKIRIRACGICIHEDKVLMMKHQAILGRLPFWAPPGGGVELGETASDALKREFLEETGLVVEVNELLLMNEFVNLPLHGIELFFRVQIKSGVFRLGNDPEHAPGQQLILSAEWLSLSEIHRLMPEQCHKFWKKFIDLSDILRISK